MKQLIERLRQLEAAALAGDPKLLGETTTSMEFIDLLVDNSAPLLDRLEKLEAVAEAAEQHLDCDGVLTRQILRNALAALEAQMYVSNEASLRRKSRSLEPLTRGEHMVLAKVFERLDALERMANVGKDLVESSITQADILEDGSIVPTRCSVNPEVFDQFQDALAALGEDT